MQAKPSPRSNDSKLCGVCVTIKPWSMWKNIILYLRIIFYRVSLFEDGDQRDRR